MNKTFIDQLIRFIGTPAGFIGIAIGVLLIIKATQDRPTGWLLFSICGFAASLNTFVDKWVLVPPALVFPLQQIRAVGRPLAVILLILLVLLALQTQNTWRRWILPPPIKYLIFIQFAIMSKTLLYGNLEFALASALTFGGLIFMLQMGPGRWLQNDENFHLAVKAIAVVGLIFIVLNTYQYIKDPYAVTFKQGRFNGTTGNPQHAAVLLASVIPALMFLIQTAPVKKFFKFFWIGVLVVTIYFLLLTGSRTGLLMGGISILLFYRNNGGAWFRLILLGAVAAALVMPFLEPSTLSSSSGISSSVSDRFTSTNNTREEVWGYMLAGFRDNIVFGVPLSGDRMGYGENSWLASGTNLGLMGFIPMMMMGWESLKLMWKLNQLGSRQPYYFFQSSVVIAGLGSLLVGGFFEPFLLGNLTFSLIAFLTYLIMGAYLVEVDRLRRHYGVTESQSFEPSGAYQ